MIDYCLIVMMSREHCEKTRDSTCITNNDIRSMASSDLTSSKEVLSSGSVQDSLEVGSERRLSSTCLNASSSMDHTIGSEISKTSKLTSSSPDRYIKSSSTSNGSSSRVIRPQGVFTASVYDEITPIGQSSKFICIQ